MDTRHPRRLLSPGQVLPGYYTLFMTNPRLAFELRRKGLTVPITDCVIAAASESAGGCVLTLDVHFQEIAEISSLTVLPQR